MAKVTLKRLAELMESTNLDEFTGDISEVVPERKLAESKGRIRISPREESGSFKQFFERPLTGTRSEESFPVRSKTQQAVERGTDFLRSLVQPQKPVVDPRVQQILTESEELSKQGIEDNFTQEDIQEQFRNLVVQDLMEAGFPVTEANIELGLKGLLEGVDIPSSNKEL